MATIFHTHLHGDRDTKYDRLMESDISDTVWSEILPQTPFYLLIPQDVNLRIEYEKAWKITDVMLTNVLGFQTHRDHFAVDFSYQELEKRISEFRNSRLSDKEIQDRYNVSDNRDWNVKEARQSLRQDQNWKESLITCLYRSFDWRYCYFSTTAMDYPRQELIKHVAKKENLCLGVGRQGIAVNDPQWSLVSVSGEPVDANIFRRGGINVFPLYLYPEAEERALGGTRRPNLSQPFLNDVTAKLDYTPTPEGIFYYIYAIFHSPTYRSRYAEFLKIDFPRVPLTRNDKLFRKLAAYGEQLVALHLMKSPKLDQPITQFVEQGGNRIVDPAHPKYANGKVTINKKGDGFMNVPEEVWNFYVGGYPVCAKWLKDRKGRTLSSEDIAHYQRIVVALQETIKLMAAIDKAIPSFPIE
jgi:predicted helicase